jgi:hypothetical protein
MKYPRTFHHPESPGVSSDDKVIKTLDAFIGQQIIISLKYDGENTTGTNSVCHARSLDSANHPSRNWVKNFHGSFKHLIPDGWRICGENLYATHSIHYQDLESYFFGFSVWDDRNVALDWDSTLLWFEEFGITPVKELYRGEYNDAVITNLIKNFDTKLHEGFVCRVIGEIPYEDFNKLVFKWVRPNHVQTETHWMHSEMKVNKLKGI